MHQQFSRNFGSTFGFAVSDRAKSLVRNILPASPYFPRFYRDGVISPARNSNEAKILADQRQKKIVSGYATSNAGRASRPSPHGLWRFARSAFRGRSRPVR
jgi:hypothetical protein